MSHFQEFTVDDWVEYTQKQHWRSIDLKLDRIESVWKRMEGKKPNFVITVAGTNGKGSSVSMLDAVFQEAGKTTGAYTSPHLLRYNERIKINGISASDEDICAGFCAIQQARQDISLTYFEFGTLCALWVFNRHEIEVAILEVGMGGRLDAVNMIDNDIALITTIDIDHEQWLGRDREKIGQEKAGVIKYASLAVCADIDPPESIAQTAGRMQATLLQRERDYKIEKLQSGIAWSCDSPYVTEKWRHVDGLHSPFGGEHQIQNLAGVVATLALSAPQTGVSIHDLQTGIEKASLNARCRILSAAPQVVVDVAHNRQSAKELARFLADTPHPGGLTLVVLGVLEDKSLEDIAGPVLEQVNRWYLAGLPGERGQSSDQLHEKLLKIKQGIQVVTCDSPVEAYSAALEAAADNDRIVIFGSFYTVGDIIGFIEVEGSLSFNDN